MRELLNRLENYGPVSLMTCASGWKAYVWPGPQKVILDAYWHDWKGNGQGAAFRVDDPENGVGYVAYGYDMPERALRVALDAIERPMEMFT